MTSSVSSRKQTLASHYTVGVKLPFGKGATGTDVATDPHALAEYAIKSLLDDPSLTHNQKLVDAQTAFGARPTHFGTWMKRLMEGTPEQQLDILCDMVLEGAPKHLNADQVRVGLKEVFRKSLEDLGKGNAAALDKVFMGKLQEHLAHVKGNLKVEASWMEQFKTNAAASTVAGIFGFGFIAIFMKTLIHLSGLGLTGVHFVILAGPWIAFVVDFVIGGVKGNASGGAGYVAVDVTAMLDHNTAMSNRDSLVDLLKGLKENPIPDKTQIEKVEKEIAAEELKAQVIVVDCLRREYGKVLGLKRPEHRDDISRDCLLQCLNSKLKVTPRVVFEVGSEYVRLFKVVSDPTDGDVRVQWNDEAKTTTSLLKDPIPAHFREKFDELTAKVMGAAKCRALLDDMSFLVFGIPFLWNAAGSYFTLKGVAGAAVGDTLLMFASSFFGTWMLIFWQNLLRSKITGAPTAWVGNRPVNVAAHDLLKMTRQHAVAQLETFRSARLKCEEQLLAAQDVLAALKARPEDDRPSQAELESAKDAIYHIRQVRGKLQKKCKALVKQIQEVEVEIRKTGSASTATWEGFKANWTKLLPNPPRLAFRLVGFTLCYIAYGELWTLELQQSQKPPFILDNSTADGNFTNNGTMSGHYDLDQALPYMFINGMGGAFMASIFAGRNRITAAGEYYTKKLWGKLMGCLARGRDNSALADPDRLKDKWSESDLKAAYSKRGQQIIALFGRIPADVLADGGAQLSQALDDLRDLDMHVAGFDKSPWTDQDIRLFRSTLGLLLEEWDAVGPEFGSMATDAKKAFQNVRAWCSDQLNVDDSDVEEEADVILRPNSSDEDVEVIPDYEEVEYIGSVATDYASISSRVDENTYPGIGLIGQLLGAVRQSILLQKEGGSSRKEAALDAAADNLNLNADQHDEIAAAAHALYTDWDNNRSAWGNNQALATVIADIHDWAVGRFDVQSSSSDDDAGGHAISNAFEAVRRRYRHLPPETMAHMAQLISLPVAGLTTANPSYDLMRNIAVKNGWTSKNVRNIQSQAQAILDNAAQNADNWDPGLVEAAIVIRDWAMQWVSGSSSASGPSSLTGSFAGYFDIMMNNLQATASTGMIRTMLEGLTRAQLTEAGLDEDVMNTIVATNNWDAADVLGIQLAAQQLYADLDQSPAKAGVPGLADAIRIIGIWAGRRGRGG